MVFGRNFENLRSRAFRCTYHGIPFSEFRLSVNMWQRRYCTCSMCASMSSMSMYISVYLFIHLSCSFVVVSEEKRLISFIQCSVERLHVFSSTSFDCYVDVLYVSSFIAVVSTSSRTKLSIFGIKGKICFGRCRHPLHLSKLYRFLHQSVSLRVLSIC